ncbi:PAS/PAC sensor hybrid histidine kinase [Magnetococcus marinus MC-1]|uniref:histidine kinase n=2 Tax=Magnetococcus TaxID=162171 RepID=A0LDH4_MAGMM|nr:PAS/PAC sensor hybrid histidine kinase [Magnetococcus marinus MC-1]
MSLWSLLVLSSLLWNLSVQTAHQQQQLLERNRHTFQLIQFTRQWNAQHGGVYARVTAETQPNPFLKNLPQRDLTSTDGVALTLINPAYMTRQIAELARHSGMLFHITSLKPLRPANRPDNWEAEALKRFETNPSERLERLGHGDSALYRYMAPLYVEQSCLKCHATQGYQLGDIRGGISITVSAKPLDAAQVDVTQKLVASHAGIWLLMSLILGLVWRRHNRYVETIKAHEQQLETRVQDRTDALRQANDRLERDRSQLQQIIDGVSEPLMVIRTDYRIVLMNEAARSYNPELATKQANCYCHLMTHQRNTPCEGHDHPCPLEQVVRTQQPFRTVHRHINRDGLARFVSLQASPLFDQNGALWAIIESSRDITEYMSMQEQLKQESDTSNAIIDALSGLFILLDADGCLVRWNSNLAKMTGLDEQSFAGRSILDFVAPTSRNAFIEAMEKVLTEGLATQESYLQTMGRQQIPFAFQINRIEIEGKLYLSGMGVDISEQLSMRHALQESQDILDQVQKVAQLGGIVWKPASGFMQWSAQVYPMLGLQPGQRSLSLRTLLHGLSRHARKGLLQRLGELRDTRHHVIERELHLLGFDGIKRYLHLRGQHRQSHDQEHPQILITLQDLTPHKIIQHQLQHQLTFQQTLLNTIPIPVFYKDRQLRYQIANEAFSKLLNQPLETLIGRTVYETSPLEMAKIYDIADHNLLDHPDRVQQYQATIQPQSDNPHHVVFYKAVVPGEQGQHAGIVGAILDVTEQTRAQKALEESNRRFETVLGSLESYLFVTNIESNMVLFTNHAARLRFGETVGQPCWKTFHLGCKEGGCQSCIQGGASIPHHGHHWEYHNKESGEWYTIRIRLIPWTDGHYVRLLVANDITVLKQAQEASRQAMEQAERANRAKSEFLATMSHEIRTPMNVVVGMSDILLESLPNPQAQKHIQLIQKAGTTLLDLINDILDLSKIEAGQLELEHAVFNPILLIEDTIAIFQMQAKLKGLTLTSSMTGHIPHALMGDRARLRQILVNLLGNAIKFTEKGSVEVQAGYANQQFWYAVVDSGVGIGSDSLLRIFDKFTQADSGVARRFGGSGLGLAICKNLMELMGGTIETQSTLGQGSRFYCAIPAPIADHLLPSDVVTKEPITAALPALTILLVDDSEDNRILVRTYLKQSQHKLDEAVDGAQAVKMAIEKRYHLIFMDIQMPIMDGYRATAEIRAHEQQQGLSPTPILALTAHALSADVEKSLAAGCNEHLTKPIRKKDLLRVVNHFAAQLETDENSPV